MSKIQMEYPDIDPIYTGCKIKKLMDDNGYDVSDLQEYLHLGWPQSIYRWLSGKKLPTLEQVYALSTLFKVHMEDIIAPKAECAECIEITEYNNSMRRRLTAYARALFGKVA